MLVSYSNSLETLIYKINLESYSPTIEKIVRLKQPAIYSYFSNNTKNLVLISNEEIVIYDYSNKTIIKEIEISNNSNILNCCYDSINNKLAVTFLNNSVYIYDLNSISDYNKAVKININSANNNYVTLLKYINNNNDLLLVFNNNNIRRYSIKNQEFVSISDVNAKNNNNNSAYKTPNKDNLEINDRDVPKNLLTWYNKIIGIVEINSSLLLAYTDYNIIPILLNKEIPEMAVIKRDLNNRNKAKSRAFYLREYHNALLNSINTEFDSNKNLNKTKIEINSSTLIDEESSKDKSNMNFAIITKFISNTFIDYVNDKLFVVEIDWENILKNMVSPIVKQRFKK